MAFPFYRTLAQSGALLFVLNWACADEGAPTVVVTDPPDTQQPQGAAPILDVDFQDYASTAALLGDCSTFNCVEDNRATPSGGVGTIELDASVAPPIPGLTKSMRYSYQHPGNGCNSITLGRAVRFPAAQQAWAEFYVRWSANFTTTNNSCPPNDHKLIFGDTEADESGRWAFYVGADTGPQHNIQVERPLGPSGFLGAYYPNRNSAGLRPSPHLWNGQWHVIRLYFRNSTTASSTDGAMKVWIDGALVHDESGFTTRKPARDGGGAERINGFSFSHNKDDGPAGVLMHLWWGRIRVYTSNPGW